MLSTQFLHCDLVCINVVQGRGLVCFLLDILVFSIALHFCSDSAERLTLQAGLSNTVSYDYSEPKCLMTIFVS